MTNIYANPGFVRDTSKEARKDWHDALLSTQYPQGSGKLFDGEGLCCLGVYAHEVRGWKLYILGGAGSLVDINPVMEPRHRIGSNPFLGRTDDRPFSASEINDKLNLGFDEIAKLVYPEAYVNDPSEMVIEVTEESEQ